MSAVEIKTASFSGTSSRGLLLLSTSISCSICYSASNMDPSNDGEFSKCFASHSSSNIPQYLESSDTRSSSPAHAPWYAAGSNYSFTDLGLFESSPWTGGGSVDHFPASGTSSSVDDDGLAVGLSGSSYLHSGMAQSSSDASLTTLAFGDGSEFLHSPAFHHHVTPVPTPPLSFLTQPMVDSNTGELIVDRPFSPPVHPMAPLHHLDPLSLTHPCTPPRRQRIFSTYPESGTPNRSFIKLSELFPPYIPNDSTDDPSMSSTTIDNPFFPPISPIQRLKNHGTRGKRTMRYREQAVAAAKNAYILNRGRPSYEYSSSSPSRSSENGEHPSPPLMFTQLDPGTSADFDCEFESERDDDAFRTPSPSNYSGSTSPPRLSKNKKNSGGKKIGAADALRLVTREGEDEAGPSTAQGRSRARRNQSIPFPVPVPHLTKKSRGRKVPHVRVQPTRSPPTDDESEDGETVRGSSSRRGGRGGKAGGRSFVCIVEGCGKCFVRGEHLKRHVRSIHTHEKPYPCPAPNCGKSFSRRDNLAQHARLHLNDST